MQTAAREHVYADVVVQPHHGWQDLIDIIRNDSLPYAIMPRSEDLCDPTVKLCSRGVLAQALMDEQILLPVKLLPGEQIGQIACSPTDRWAEIAANKFRPAYMHFLPPDGPDAASAETLQLRGITVVLQALPHDSSIPGSNWFEV